MTTTIAPRAYYITATTCDTVSGRTTANTNSDWADGAITRTDFVTLVLEANAGELHGFAWTGPTTAVAYEEIEAENEDGVLVTELRPLYFELVPAEEAR